MIKSKQKLKAIAVLIILALTLNAMFFNSNSSNLKDTELIAYADGYNPSAATEYARTYWQNYNPNYPNYNYPGGGDCANFVSQCLYAGGFPMNDDWYMKSSGTHSEAWSYCPSMYNYFKSAGYTVIENPSNDQVKEGNPVLYWREDKNRWGHAAICIGNNSSGVPVVAAHNNDRWVANWKLGYSKTCTIIINGDVSPTPTPTPDPTPTITNVNEKYRVTTNSSNLNVRASYSASSALVTSVAKGTEITITQITDTNWGYCPDLGGWLSLDYCTKIEDTPTNLDAPVLTLNRGTSLTTDTITISWPPANGAESYWLHIYKDGEDYVNKSINQDLSYSAKYPAGNYAAYVVSCNNGLEALSLVEFTVLNLDAPVLTLNRGTSLTTDTITISWPPANGAESYWLHIYKDGADYVNQSINQDLSYSAKYPAGNYAAYVVSCNNGLEALSLVEFTVYDATPLNLGDSFNAYIVNNAPWKMLTVENNNNVGLYTENRKAEQMWQFTRRADGSYEILNSKTGLALDSGDANNTNLFTFADCDNEWQSWYIYGSPDNYFFKSKYSGKVIDVVGGATDDGTNVQMYEFNDTAAQKFSIYYFDHGSNLGVIQNLGDKFTARIVNNLSQKSIQPKEDTSVVLQSEANNIGQLWEFTRNSDGSYKIMNCKSGLVLDSGGENNTVYMHNDYGNIYQNWYIFGTDGNYCFKSQATNYVIEAWGGATDDGTIIQLYDSNGTEAQKFYMDIFDINNKAGNLNLDDTLTIADMVLFKEYLTSIKQISEIQYLVADVNQDGKINVFDMIIIKRLLLENN